MTMIPKTIVAMSMLVLSGCSLLSPVKTDNKATYFINAVPQQLSRHKGHAATLLVMAPDTSPAYNTIDMAYTIRPYQIAYFSQNRWAETPAQMLQPLLVQTLQNTHYFHAVVTAPYTGHYDYVLYTQILQLQQDFTHHIPKLRLLVRIQLSNTTTNRIIATKLFLIQQPILQHTPYHGVIAANCATADLLKQIAIFSLEKIH